MEEKVSVIIPNFNGYNLLLKNLPNVLRFASKSEILLIDDASSDDSVNLVRKKFKRVKIIKNKNNLGFAKTANIGVSLASGDYVLLLNSDVSPNQDFISKALKDFTSDTFAVGLCDKSYENGKVILKGRGGATFKKGFVNHFPAVIEKGETLWVSGGSGIFRRKLFLELGGFDKIYSPYYWEDIDLSFRAWRKGYKCLFEPFAKVDHYHEEGAIKKINSAFKIKSISYRNQILFVWKNIDNYYMLIHHLFWLPYHITKSIFTLDFAFLLGFVWAIFKIPNLMFDDDSNSAYYKLSVKEVLDKFEKS